MTALPSFLRRMTATEFQQWPGDGTDAPYDLIVGEPVMQAAASRQHGEVQAALSGLLFIALQNRRPCRPITEVGITRSPRDHTQRTADIVVTCDRSRRGDTAPPPVVIEILSPSNRAETLAKLEFYGSIQAIREIVLVESERRGARVHRRAAGPEWLLVPAEEVGPGGMLTLAAVDVSIPLDAIYRDLDVD